MRLRGSTGRVQGWDRGGPQLGRVALACTGLGSGSRARKCGLRGAGESAASVRPPRALGEQKQKMRRLGSDLSSAQKEMRTKHKAYESAVGILSRRLQEALAAKETAEAELSQLRAHAADGGSDLALRVGTGSALVPPETGRDVLWAPPPKPLREGVGWSSTGAWQCVSDSQASFRVAGAAAAQGPLTSSPPP